jgi:RNA polymerase sigma factor (sigma-70 family)
MQQLTQGTREAPGLVLVDDPARETVRRIQAGDGAAWRELVDRYEPLLRRLTRQYRLSGQDADDAVQVTWLRCLEHVDQLAQADRLGAWLATICRRECLRLATRGRREVALGEPAVTRLVDSDREERDPGIEMARRDEQARLSLAITALSERQRSVVLELVGREGQSYLDLSRRLGLPVGSIGPTWQRALARLRQDPLLADLSKAS